MQKHMSLKFYGSLELEGLCFAWNLVQVQGCQRKPDSSDNTHLTMAWKVLAAWSCTVGSAADMADLMEDSA